MNQLLLGASVPFAIGIVVYVVRRCRTSFRMLVIVPACMVLSMLWAIAPDIPLVFGCRELYFRLATDPRCDIFFWHYSIDQAEFDSPWFAVGFVLMLASLLFAAWRELGRVEGKS